MFATLLELIGQCHVSVYVLFALQFFDFNTVQTSLGC